MQHTLGGTMTLNTLVPFVFLFLSVLSTGCMKSQHALNINAYGFNYAIQGPSDTPDEEATLVGPCQPLPY
jgi:hypothetical protein